MSPTKRAELAKTILETHGEFLDNDTRSIVEHAASPESVAKEQWIASQRSRSSRKWALIMSGVSIATVAGGMLFAWHEKVLPDTSTLMIVVAFAAISGAVFGWVFGRERW